MLPVGPNCPPGIDLDLDLDLDFDRADLLLVLSNPLFSDDCIATACCRTDRLTDHATSPRHASTASPRNPRTAPTAIKMAPSGVLDVCM